MVGHVTGKGHLVGDDHHGHVLGGKLADDLQDLAGQLWVEGGGGLVEEQDLRLHGQRAGDGYALLLSAGELVGVRVLAVGKAHLLQKLPRVGVDLVLRALLDQNRGLGDVLQHGVVGKEVEVLKHQAEGGLDAAQLGAAGVDGLAVYVTSGILAQIGQVAAVHGLQQRGAAQQRALAAARRADDGHHLTLLHRQGDVVEHLQLPEVLAHVIDFQNFHGARSFHR